MRQSTPPASHEHPAVSLEKSRELNIVDFIDKLEAYLDSTLSDACNILITLLIEYDLEILEQSRAPTKHSIISALVNVIEGTPIRDINVTIPVQDGLVLTRPFRNCTVSRKSMGKAIEAHGGFEDGLPFWPGLERLSKYSAPNVKMASKKNSRRKREDALTVAIRLSWNDFRQSHNYEPTNREFYDYLCKRCDDKDDNILYDYTDEKITWLGKDGLLHDTKRKSISNRLTRLRSRNLSTQ